MLRRMSGFVRAVPLVAIVVAGCDDKSGGASEAKAPAMVEKVEGTASVGGKPAKVTSCKAAKRTKGVAAELTLDTGLTIAVDPVDGVQWRKGDGAFAHLDCDQINLGSSTSGSAGDLAWATGGMKLKCTHPDGAIETDLTYDCGAVDRPSNKK
jgi:hypothetical protein